MKEQLHFKNLENMERKKSFCTESVTLQPLLYSFSTLEELLPNSSVNCKGKNHDTLETSLH